MNDRSEIPVSPIKRAEMMEKILTTSATGGPNDDHAYEVLRREFMKDPGLKELLPESSARIRNLSAFWPFIKNAAGTYAERRQIISMAFTPLIEHLEDRRAMPGDQIASDALESFDTEGVYQVWSKALARRSTDPEGAITIARTLLETVAKRILDELDEEYESSSNLPKLYAKTVASWQGYAEEVAACLGPLFPRRKTQQRAMV